MDPKLYRALQLGSITGHSGSSVTEVILISSICLASLFTYSSLRIGSSIGVYTRWMYEFAVFVIPQIFVVLFSDYYWHLFCLLITTGLLFRIGQSKEKDSNTAPEDATIRCRNLAEMPRAVCMMQTYLSIFAVDFSIYPRKFAKTEYYGISLMDTGVGLYICMNAWSMALRKRRSSSESPTSFLEDLLKCIYRVAPLLILWFGRLYFVKEYNYQEHITEYGVHWNFFATLACLNVIILFVERLFTPKSMLVLTVALSLVYEVILQQFDFKSYILRDGHDRADSSFVYQNKEGIFGLVGYSSIHMSMYALSYYLFLPPGGECSSRRSFKKKLATFAGPCFAFSLLYYILRVVFNMEPSRRLANVTFVLWIDLFVFLQVSAYVCMQYCLDGHYISTILFSSLNHNPLVTFLIANILTGAANLSFQTLLLNDAASISLIISYMFTICLISFVMKNVIKCRLL